MKIVRDKGGKTVISGLNSNAIAAMLKFNNRSEFVFTTVDNVKYKVFVEPDLEGGCILSSDHKGEKTFNKNFEESLKFIGDMMKRGVLTLEIPNKTYAKIRKFVDISEKVNERLTKKVKYYDYDSISNVYSIVYPNVNKLPVKLHYFENNNSVLMFDEKGPHLMFGQATRKIQSILDILTKS